MRSALRSIELTFFAIALACGGYYFYNWYQSREYQRLEMEELKRVLPPATGQVLPPEENEPVLPPPPGLDPKAVGLIEIPRLDMIAVVRAGEDDGTLSKAVGWLPDTAMPWKPGGNVGLAAHRDTFFRPIRHIEVNDQILLATRRGTYRYLVESTSIVRPEDVGVLGAVGHSALTLVTCYPFNFIGHAPKRFIVRARQVSDPPPPGDACSRIWRSIRPTVRSKSRPSSGRATNGPLVSAGTGRLLSEGRAKSLGCSTCRSPDIATAISIAFSNCLTLPGQSCRQSRSRVSGDSALVAMSSWWQTFSTKWRASIRTSLIRSRSGGICSGTTFKR